MSLSLQHAEEYPELRREFYRILSAPEWSREHTLRNLLDLGRDALDVSGAYIGVIDPEQNHHELHLTTGDSTLAAGETTPLDGTHCHETVRQTGICAVPHAGKIDDMAGAHAEIRCYVGYKLPIEGDLQGTLAFVDYTPRASEFTEAERSFVSLLGEAVARLLERDVHEAQLRSERELAELFVREVTDYAIFTLDPAGFVTGWNSGARYLYGYTEDEILGEHVATLYPEEDRWAGRPADLLSTAWESGRVEGENWRHRIDGSRFWALDSITALYDDGEIRGFGVVTRDLSDHRQLISELETERRFTERALNVLEDIYVVLDDDHTITRVNDRTLAVTGYTEGEILGTGLHRLFVPEHRERLEDAIERSEPEGHAAVEATLMTHNGERRRYEVRMESLDAEASAGMVAVGRDITEHSLYEERLEVAQRVLRHNLRNELNVILGWAERIEDETVGRPRDAADRIIRTTEELIRLSEQTRDMTEIEVPPDGISTVPLRTPIQVVVEEYSRRYPDASIETSLDVDGDLRVPNGARFRTALRNVVENAIEHNPSQTPWVRVEVQRQDGQVHVHVHDQGPRIPEEERAVIREGETPLIHGSSMGLWLINWAMSALGGEVWFSERDPQGNTVTLALPTIGDA